MQRDEAYLLDMLLSARDAQSVVVQLTRNRLIHAYFEVDIDKVWETIQDDLPALIDHLQLLVPPERP